MQRGETEQHTTQQPHQNDIRFQLQAIYHNGSSSHHWPPARPPALGQSGGKARLAGVCPSEEPPSPTALVQQVKLMYHRPVAPEAYQITLEPGIGQFRQFESPRAHTRINSWVLFLVHKMT